MSPVILLASFIHRRFNALAPVAVRLLAVLALCSRPAAAQIDSANVRHTIEQLCAPALHGRGYVQNGMGKAADYLAARLQAMELQVQQQSFSLPVNTFPGAVQLRLGNRELVPGRDFLVGPASGSYQGVAMLNRYDSATLFTEDRKLLLERVNKLTWSVAPVQQSYASVQVLASAWPQEAGQVVAHIEAVHVPAFEARNVLAMVPGTRVPDSMIVFTAHYDHLGRMGQQALFAGANDNASGVALLLALADHYRQQPTPYTVVFIFFAAEEAGLAGSEYFVKHPLIDLQKIRFLLNLDLMGNGEHGMTVVNATEFQEAFSLLQQLNSKGGYLPVIHARGKARNSDHYWFTERGVPSFFWYTLGARTAYHDVEDVPETLPLYKVRQIGQLILDFVQALTAAY